MKPDRSHPRPGSANFTSTGMLDGFSGLVFSLRIAIAGMLDAFSGIVFSICMVIVDPAAAMLQLYRYVIERIHGRRRRRRRGCPTGLESFLKELANEKPLRYTARDLDAYTAKYSTRLGSGGFGVVYKGKLPNGVDIAVKVLHKSMDGRAEERQFMAEVGSIGRTSHVNLVRLYGFCYDDDQTIALVFEYLENGSLDKHLFSDSQSIGWEKLYGIAVGTAKGIAYLHEDCRQRIIHYDIKPGNILLDANFVPKVADFGLAKLCNRDNTHVTMSRYRGTPGYSAPELFMNWRATHKCDVYSFGMLLFEIIGRRRNSIVGPSTESLNWFPKQVWDEYEKGELAAKIASCGIEEKDSETAERMATLAFWCVQDSPEARPPMSAVVNMLEGGVEVVPPPKPFHYLISAAVNGLSPTITTNTNNGSDQSSSNNGTNHSFWYKETAPITPEYEIQVVSTSS